MLPVLIIASFVTGAVSQFNYVCPSSWVSQGDRCYFFSFQGLPYDEAAKECRANGASLVSVDTPQETQFLTAYLKKTDIMRWDWYTSGERHPLQQAKFSWTATGTEFIPYSGDVWVNPSEPFLSDGNIIVYRYRDDYAQYRLALVGDRSKERPYICEISRNEVYRINTLNRGFDYGSSIRDLDLVPRGPSWGYTAQNTVILGYTSQLYLECIARGTPQPTYKWTRGYSKEVVTSRLDSRYTLTNGKLTIQDPTEHQDGSVYQCSASNSQGTIMAPPVTLSFSVLGEFSNVNIEPVRPKEYQGAAVTCPSIPSRVSQLSQALQYQWVKEPLDGSSLGEFVRPSLNKYLFVSGNGKLYFSEVTSADNGVYYCIVTMTALKRQNNYLGASQQPSRTSRGIVLNVLSSAVGQYKPDIQDSFIHVVPGQPLQGMDVSLECFAYGSSPLYYSWTIADWDNYRYEMTDHNRVLKIKNLRLEDSGKYKCRVSRGGQNAEFDETEFFLRVEAAPEFLLDLEHQHIDVGTRQLTWRCEARAVPFPTYSWYKDGVLLRNSTDRIVISNTLVFHNLDKARDEGMYQCVANNSHGVAFSTAQMRILSIKPSFAKRPMSRTMAGAVGGSVTIPCQPEAAPLPTFTWKHNGGQMNAIEDSTARVRKLLNGDLHISQLSYADQGTYECTVENTLGSASDTTFLKIYGSTVIQRPPITGFVDVNQTSFMYCQASYNTQQLDVTYQWTFNNHIIDFDNNRHYERGTPPANEGGLYLLYAQFEHAGLYTCTAMTQMDSANSSAVLLVRGPPSEPSGVIAYTAGEVETNTQTVFTKRDVVLRWTDPISNHGSAIENYMIYGMTNYSSTWTSLYPFVPQAQTVIPGLIDGQRRQFTLQNLKPGCAYRFKVYATNKFGIGDGSVPSTYVVISGDAPKKAPENVGGGGGHVGTLRITWTPLHPEDHNGWGIGYVVEWRLKPPPGQSNSNAKWESTVVTGNVGNYSHTVGKGNFYKVYEVRVTPKNIYGEGPASYNGSVYSAEGIPLATPLNVYGEAYNETALLIHWTPPTDDRDSMKGKLRGYRILYWLRPPKEKMDIDNATRLETIENAIQNIVYNDNSGQALIIGLQANTWYTFAMMVFNGAGNGPRSEINHQQTDRHAPLHYPINVEVFPAGGNAIRVHFRGVSTGILEEPLLGYKLRYWQDSNDIRHATDVDCGKNTYGVIYTIQKGTLYHMRVFGYSMGGVGKMSSPGTLFTLLGDNVMQVAVDPTTSRTQYVTHSAADGRLVTSVFTLLACLMVAVM